MSSRRKILRVAPAVLENMLRGHPMSEVHSDFPDDAKIIGCGWDELTGTIRLAVECPSFPVVEDGYFAPDMDVTFGVIISELDAILRLVTPDPLTPR